MSVVYISLGAICNVKYKIEEYHKKSDSLFFDNLLCDFQCVNYIIKNIDNSEDFLTADKFINVKKKFIVNKNIKMFINILLVITVFFFFSRPFIRNHPFVFLSTVQNLGQ